MQAAPSTRSGGSTGSARRDLLQVESSVIGGSSWIGWAAAGFKDTELGVSMKPEVGHGATEVHARV